MKDPTMSSFNEKMLEDTLNNFNAIYSIYKKNADDVKCIDAVQPFLDMQCLLGDIANAKSNIGKVALCNELSKLIDKTGISMLQVKKIVDDMGKKFIAFKNKMPMPKSEVNKILRMFNFHDYGEDDTNELDDPVIDEDNVKEVTAEQFMNVVDDTKNFIDKAKALANEATAGNKKKQRKAKKAK